MWLYLDSPVYMPCTRSHGVGGGGGGGGGEKKKEHMGEHIRVA